MKFISLNSTKTRSNYCNKIYPSIVQLILTTTKSKNQIFFFGSINKSIEKYPPQNCNIINTIILLLSSKDWSYENLPPINHNRRRCSQGFQHISNILVFLQKTVKCWSFTSGFVRLLNLNFCLYVIEILKIFDFH